ncbi:MAG: MFS transporter [Rubellimicrobium sp.]|nr:MFS transporter [Rubellimicrobium sp.]
MSAGAAGGVTPARIAPLVVQVLFVGLTLGLVRTAVPALAEAEFGVARGSFVALGGFVVAFGVVKAALNLIAGAWSERVGRRPVLIAGWIAALPVPVMVWAAPSWGWVVAATVLLGINQGLAWSMTQTAKLDLAPAGDRGRILGLNEFAGYAGVALAGLGTAVLAESLGARATVLVTGLAVVLAALALALATVPETRPPGPVTPGASGTFRQALARMSWSDRRLAALSLAGMVEKFVDALVWVILPGWLIAQGLGLGQAGAVTAVYGLSWGLAQIVTGRLSDRIGRVIPNVGGMALCAAGVLLFPLLSGIAGWSAAAAVTGLGMALLYPNLPAAVADLAAPDWRGTAIGIYRFWRDLGYAVGALGFGMAAQAAGAADAAFWFTGAAMVLATLILWAWTGESLPGHARRGVTAPGSSPGPNR